MRIQTLRTAAVVRPLVTLAMLAALAPATLAQKKEAKSWQTEPEMKIDVNKIYVARMDTTAGPIVLELYPKLAPHHVNSFVFLAKEGFYDGVIFHRVIPGFMIQGGDPTGTGTGGPGYQLKAEFNATKHTRGPFFLMHGDAPHLDNNYTAYGKVIEGMDVVDKIVNAPTGRNDRPTKPESIKSIKIEEKDAK